MLELKLLRGETNHKEQGCYKEAKIFQGQAAHAYQSVCNMYINIFKLEPHN